MDTINIEIDEEFLKDFYELAGKEPIPIEELSLEDLKKVTRAIKRLLPEKKKRDENLSGKELLNQYGEENAKPAKTILVLDDLGVITYQLSNKFRKMNYEAILSQEIFDALDKIKSQIFDVVIMDLFIPTEREGFLFLNELKKYITQKELDTKIVVMSATAKKEHKKQCMLKGADYFVEKIDNWQNSIVEICN